MFRVSGTLSLADVELHRRTLLRYVEIRCDMSRRIKIDVN